MTTQPLFPCWPVPALERCAKKMNLRLTLLLIFATMALIPLRASAKELDPNRHKSIHYCYLLEKRYAFAVSDEAYKNMTKWNIKSEEPPPVSPQKAFKLAKERLDKIK